MKNVLVVGSAVVDVIINLDHLPGKEEDVHVLSQQMSLGGCAYNTFEIIRHFDVPCIPFFPVGTGIYGHFVRTHPQLSYHKPLSRAMLSRNHRQRAAIPYIGASSQLLPARWTRLRPCTPA